MEMTEPQTVAIKRQVWNAQIAVLAKRKAGGCYRGQCQGCHQVGRCHGDCHWQEK